MALSELEIKGMLPYEYDRATLFRTLRTFVENKLIHEVIVHKNEVKYALTRTQVSVEDQPGGHAHFHCDVCGRVFLFGRHLPYFTKYSGWL